LSLCSHFSALTELKLQISSAKISTFGQRAVDVFYVKDLYGLKIAADPRLKAIRARLLEALEPASAAAAPPDAATAAQ
jgi:[protein-PII] uridylyltransferase